MKNVLKGSRIINSKRQPKNLKRILCKSKFQLDDSNFNVTKCTDPRCGTCEYLIEENSLYM